MMLGIKIYKKRAESLRIWLKERNLISTIHKAVKDGDYVVFPIIRELSNNELQKIYENIGPVEIIECKFPTRRRRVEDIVDILSEALSPAELASLPTSFDVIGEIALIEIPVELFNKSNIIGSAIMRLYKNVKAVYAKSPVRGTYRVREELRLIAGEPITETMHKEYGTTYRLDVTKVFFDPRLSWEHNRVANLVRSGEVVIDMFSGIGPFSIQIARRVNALIYSIDINLFAYHYLIENVRINRVKGRIIPILGDSGRIVGVKLKGIADRIIMNNPSQSHLFLSKAISALKNKGVIHYYSFGDNVERVTSDFLSMCKNEVRDVKINYKRKVKSSAPREWLIVIDALISR